MMMMLLPSAEKNYVTVTNTRETKGRLSFFFGATNPPKPKE